MSDCSNPYLTLEQAAEMLNVSTSFVAQECDDEALSFVMIDGAKHIRHRELVAYKQRAIAEREKILDELTDEAQRDSMGYAID